MNQIVESLQEFWRRITSWRSSIHPSTPKLSHSHSHSHEDVQIRWSKDQISITLSLSLSKYLILSSSSRCLDLRALLSLSQRLNMRAFSSLSRNLDMRALDCCVLLLTISSSFIAFHDSQKAAKCPQNQPKAAFLGKRALLPSLVCVCFSPSFSMRVQNLNASLLFFL